MKKSELIKLAQQGHHQAIALLLNHSLQSHNIQATVGEHAGTLHILLESQTLPAQATYSKVIHQGLQRLAIASIDKAHVYGRTLGSREFAWKTVVSLRENTILDQSQFTRLPSQFSSLEASPPQLPASKPPLRQRRRSGRRFQLSWLIASLASSVVFFIIVGLFNRHRGTENSVLQLVIAALIFITVGSTGWLLWTRQQPKT